MPEPGVNDRNFYRPMTKTVRGPVGNRPGGRRLRIPGEYAEFRLEDGRVLGEVLGPDFFGPESDHVTEKQREELRVGNYAPAGYGLGEPERLAMPPTRPATPERGNDARFGGLSFGPEEREAENAGPSFPVARPRPVRGRAEEQDSARGFRMFDLPLTAEGPVDKDALVPGSVYRIPESAGGGLGQWKSQSFYNFDGKADWRMRSPEDLDAYSGASDGSTPEERTEKISGGLQDGLDFVKSGGVFTPAIKLTAGEIDSFNEGDRGGIRANDGDDEVIFSFGGGEEFLVLPDDAAAHVVRNWDDFRPRLALLTKLHDETLSPEELRRLVENEVFRPVREAAAQLPGSPVGGRGGVVRRSRVRDLTRVADARLGAYDDLVAALESGASDREVAALLESFQQAMLPELLGWGPALGEVVKDVIPGLSNVRSAFHAWNDLIEIAEEFGEGDVLGIVGNSGMLALDIIGMIPVVGSAASAARTTIKSGARGTVRVLGQSAAGRLASKWISRRRLATYLNTTTDKLRSRSVEEYFGKVWGDLMPEMRRLLRKRFVYFVGRAGELAMMKEAREAGFGVLDDFDSRKFDLSKMNGGRQFRVFDFLTEQDFKKVWNGVFMAPGEKGDAPFGLEVKVNLSEYVTDQELADEFLEEVGRIAGSDVLRLPAKLIKPEHLADAVEEWMKRPWRKPWRRPQGVPKKEVEALIEVLQAQEDMSVGELFGLVLSYRLSREALRSQQKESGNSFGLADYSDVSA